MRKIHAVTILLILVMQLAMAHMTLATHSATISWVKTQKDDPSYLLMPGGPDEYFWNGITPKWIRFTVRNNGPDAMKEIKLVFQKFPDGNVMFNFSQTSQSKAGWYVTPDEFGPNKRPTVLYFRTDSQYIQTGETVTFGLFMTGGPEECRHNIDVWTVDAGSTPSTNFYELWILIDKHSPLFADQVTPPSGSVFDGNRNPTVEVTASATDIWPPPNTAPHISNIKNMTVRIDYRVNSETPLPNGPPNPPKPQPYFVTMKWDPSRRIYYIVLDSDHGLIDEAWHDCTAIFYDYAENGPVTNINFTYFFWFLPHDLVKAKTIDPCFLYWKMVGGKNGIGHVGGNAIVERDSGFRPSIVVDARFDSTPISPPSGVLTDNWGRFMLNFKVPLLPFGRHTIVLTPRLYPQEANQTYFYIIPWMEIVGDRSGNVGAQITVMGTGFDANALVDVIYRDVSRGLPPCTDPTTEWSDFATSYTWSPHLENLTVSPRLFSTNSSGAFTLAFNIPESYGGWHPVFAQEVLNGRRSGWMDDPHTDPASIFPEAAFVKVMTKTWTVPTIGLSGQFIKIFATGLPLPEYQSTTFDCKTGRTTREDHSWTLALDFGDDNKYWVFEKGFILNNEFDLGWSLELYLPFAYWYNHDDPKSPIWNGTLYWKDFSGTIRRGSQFLKVPAIMNKNYTISLYEFSRQTDTDEKAYLATTNFTVLKDPLYVRASSGSLYFRGEKVTVYAEVDLDGVATNPTEISFRLYYEDSFLMNLTAKQVSDGQGLYVASFTCPPQEGNYFVKVNASKALDESLSLSGFGVTSFVVSPTLNGLNATLTAINNGLATITTRMGTITLDLQELEANVTAIDGKVATIITSVGSISTDVSTINGKVTGLNGSLVTISTSLGILQTDVSNINGRLVSLNGSVATVQTDVGTLKADISTISGKVTGLNGSLVTISTSLGILQTDVSNINGRLVSLIGSVATVQTDVGTLEMTLDGIGATITATGADAVTIKTAVGDIQGKITSVDGRTADIQTNLGLISASTDSIKAQTGLQPTSIALSLVGALAAIIAAVLIFRKLYK